MSVELPEPPFTGFVPGWKLQLGVGLPPPVTVQESVTLPLNPLDGATVTVEAAEAPAVTKAGTSGLAMSK
jgi:hypothetical protein